MPRFVLPALALAVGLVACSAEPDGQRIEASGVVVERDGAPAQDRRIESYSIFFRVADGPEIERRFPGTTTDDGGEFQLEIGDAALSYEWQQDEYVCEDVCTAYETSCGPVTEDVCETFCDTTTTTECTDECYDECQTVCYDETVCDAYGCWVETTCDDECTTHCEPVCEPVVEEDCWDECHQETYEVCDDYCIEYVEQCGWETRTYTSYPTYAEIESARAEIVVNVRGEERIVAGEALESRQAESCEGRGQCRPIELWVQRDRFVLP